MLHIAAYLGLYIACTKLLEFGFDINSRDALDYTPLHHTASKGHTHVVKLLLQNNTDATARSFDLQPVLGYAAISGHESVIRMLLEHEADRDLELPEKTRAMNDAGQRRTVQTILLKHLFIEPPQNRTPTACTTALHQAVYQSDMATMELPLGSL
jgi:ankyrin repeat protein